MASAGIDFHTSFQSHPISGWLFYLPLDLGREGEDVGILNNKGKPKHKRLRRHMGRPLTALAAVLCVAVAPVASANMNVIDVSGWQSADVTRVVDADAAIVKITEGSG